MRVEERMAASASLLTEPDRVTKSAPRMVTPASRMPMIDIAAMTTVRRK
jgi:hypothetical protein